ncbi:MAG: SnoaL-like domain-containing protein [Polyangiaceae bacterium]|nr:SnoaL-like domain-containing protein [Polyangiaceae bacterium]
MQIAIVLFDGFTALDAIGPYEVLKRLPSTTLHFVAERRKIIHTSDGLVAMAVTETLADVPRPDVVVMPGGPATRELMSNEALIEWVRRAHESSAWTTSVCTGSLILAKAGVLSGLEATGHWMWLEPLREAGANPSSKRVIVQGKVITSAGVSSGIDMALALAARISGEDVAKAIQLAIEYDPEPPFDCGSPEKAGTEIVELCRRRAAAAKPKVPFDPDRFAREWAEQWNRRDVDAVLSHFASNVRFTSPRAKELMGHATVDGIEELGAYFRKGAPLLGTMRFVVDETIWDAARRTLTIIYDRHRDGGIQRACEIMRFDSQGLVREADALYGA